MLVILRLDHANGVNGSQASSVDTVSWWCVTRCATCAGLTAWLLTVELLPDHSIHRSLKQANLVQFICNLEHSEPRNVISQHVTKVMDSSRSYTFMLCNDAALTMWWLLVQWTIKLPFIVPGSVTWRQAVSRDGDVTYTSPVTLHKQ